MSDAVTRAVMTANLFSRCLTGASRSKSSLDKIAVCVHRSSE